MTEMTREITTTKMTRWYDVKILELTMFFLKIVVAALPAIALTFLIYIITILSVVTASGLLR